MDLKDRVGRTKFINKTKELPTLELLEYYKDLLEEYEKYTSLLETKVVQSYQEGFNDGQNERDWL